MQRLEDPSRLIHADHVILCRLGFPLLFQRNTRDLKAASSRLLVDRDQERTGNQRAAHSREAEDATADLVSAVNLESRLSLRS